MKTPLILRILLYAVLLAIGIIVGIAIQHYKNIPLSTEVNLIDLATLVVTVFLAVYIPEVLDQRLQNTQDKKKLIENRIAEYQGILRKINGTVQSDILLDEKTALVVKNNVDILQHKLATAVSLLSYANFKITFEREIDSLKALTDRYAEVIRTGVSAPGNSRISSEF
ncbi:MAG: hypothetical protein LUD68_07185 [Rikenellaceae bacterium]|nr:hypothetical protein [Rikenellaceae bacterium]